MQALARGRVLGFAPGMVPMSKPGRGRPWQWPSVRRRSDMKAAIATCIGAAMTIGAALLSSTAMVQAQDQAKPNILVIMGDDVGWFNIGAYHRGIMSGKTPNLDKLAAEGMMFTDYYAEASCTAGRASFITGEIPLRTGLTTVGQAGADVGMPDQGRNHRSRPQGRGICDRPVRQEPSRRSEQIPADAAWLRRVLRIPLSPRRDVGSRIGIRSRTTSHTATRSGREIWSIHSRPIRTIRPSSRGGERSASKGSSTRVRWRRIPT